MTRGWKKPTKIVKVEDIIISKEMLKDYYDSRYKQGWEFKRYGKNPNMYCRLCYEFYKEGELAVRVLWVTRSYGIYHRGCWKIEKAKRDSLA